MVSCSQICLIAPIESNIECLNKQTGIVKFPRLYENEAIRCFKSWRKNGGWLKDIPIYTLCSSKNTISKETIRLFNEMNVIYIEQFCEDTASYSSGFLQLPYCGKFFQSIYPIEQDITIRIDLDMVLLKPLDCQLFNNIENETVIGQYDVDSLKDQRDSFNGVLPFDTGFMITHKKNNFYDLWYKLCFSDDILSSKEWIEVRKQLGDYYLEEFVVDYIFNHKLSSIKPIQKYQYGEGYASVDTFSDDQIKQLYFRHEHIYQNNRFPWGYDSSREQMKYLRRVGKIK